MADTVESLESIDEDLSDLVLDATSGLSSAHKKNIHTENFMK